MAIPSGGTPRLGLTQGDGIHGYTDSLRSLVLILLALFIASKTYKKWASLIRPAPCIAPKAYTRWVSHRYTDSLRSLVLIRPAPCIAPKAYTRWVSLKNGLHCWYSGARFRN